MLAVAAQFFFKLFQTKLLVCIIPATSEEFLKQIKRDCTNATGKPLRKRMRTESPLCNIQAVVRTYLKMREILA